MSKYEIEEAIEKLMDIGYSRWDAKLAVLGELEWIANARTFGVD